LSESEAIEALAEEFRRDDEPLYAFMPDDVEESFFIGQKFLEAAATIFISVFFEGVKEALKERGKDLGKTITNWIMDKTERLFRKPDDTIIEKEKLEKELQDFRSTASKMDAKELNETFDSVEKAIIETMKDRGVPPDKASKLAKKVRKAAEKIIKKDVQDGT
jgi:hypothetical protein